MNTISWERCVSCYRLKVMQECIKTAVAIAPIDFNPTQRTLQITLQHVECTSGTWPARKACCHTKKPCAYQTQRTSTIPHDVTTWMLLLLLFQSSAERANCRTSPRLRLTRSTCHPKKLAPLERIYHASPPRHGMDTIVVSLPRVPFCCTAQANLNGLCSFLNAA